MLNFFLVFILLFGTLPGAPLKIAAILAHPDDETTFSVTLYKLAKGRGADVDVILITNGEGGYKYSILAESFYHLSLVNEEDGRKHLPFIRKTEALNGGKILGIRNYFFLEEEDPGFTKDPRQVLDGVWNTVAIKQKLTKLIKEQNYDLIIVMLPTEDTHGHHKAASLLGLEVIRDLGELKPIIIGEILTTQDNQAPIFEELSQYPITKAKPIGRIDRTLTFGYNNKLNYKIIANWVIAEHKSQGALQAVANKGDYEDFYFFETNDANRLEEVKTFLKSLNELNLK